MFSAFAFLFFLPWCYTHPVRVGSFDDDLTISAKPSFDNDFDVAISAEPSFDGDIDVAISAEPSFESNVVEYDYMEPSVQVDAVDYLSTSRPCCESCTDYNLLCWRRCVECTSPVPPPNHPRKCCADCHGDIFCLNFCDHKCKPAKMCKGAGKGAYAAFCQQRCSEFHGYGLLPRYMPDRACRNTCAVEVTRRCSRMCEEYGCIIDECWDEAPEKCFE